VRGLQICLALSTFLPTAQGQIAGSLPESPNASIGYASVAAALKALRSKRGVTFNTQNGWLIAEEQAALTFWSFAPKGDPAYPSAVKRALVTKDGITYIDMNIRCEATKVSCDRLVIEFERLNEQARKSLQAKPK
jgi:hypothetical protein